MARAKPPLPLLALLLAAALAAPAPAPAQDAPATATDARPSRDTEAARRAKSASSSPGTPGWWMGTAFMVAVLGAAGVVCIAAKRQTAGGPSIKLQVVGRVALPPRHAVFAVRAGGRTLLIGTGPQGAPALLGELDDEAAEEPTTPLVRPAAIPTPAPHRPAASRFDVRLGDES